MTSPLPLKRDAARILAHLDRQPDPACGSELAESCKLSLQGVRLGVARHAGSLSGCPGLAMFGASPQHYPSGRDRLGFTPVSWAPSAKAAPRSARLGATRAPLASPAAPRQALGSPRPRRSRALASSARWPPRAPPPAPRDCPTIAHRPPRLVRSRGISFRRPPYFPESPRKQAPRATTPSWCWSLRRRRGGLAPEAPSLDVGVVRRDENGPLHGVDGVQVRLDSGREGDVVPQPDMAVDVALRPRGRLDLQGGGP